MQSGNGFGRVIVVAPPFLYARPLSVVDFLKSSTRAESIVEF